MIVESLSFTKTLYAFDFDGTLSKIVKVPSAATIGSMTNKLLKDLAALAPVAVVSGRSLSDLRARLLYQPRYMIGNHGLEGLGFSSNDLSHANRVAEAWGTQLAKIDFGPGVEIENKTYSLAVHYRRSRNKRDVRLQIKRVLETLDPQPRVIAGKSVINLLPTGAPHKGAAVMELARQLGTKNVFYIGDDDTDEDVFGLLDPRIMTVRVGKKVTSQARYYINRQSEINQVLKLLVRYHQPFRNAERSALELV